MTRKILIFSIPFFALLGSFMAGFSFLGDPESPFFEKENIPKFRLSSNDPEQGDTVVITIDYPPESFSGDVNGEKLDFFRTSAGNKAFALIGFDAKDEPGTYVLTVDFSSKEFKEEISLHKRDFPETVLIITPDLEEKGYTPETIAENITQTENIALNETVSVYTEKAYFTEPFNYPLDDIKDVGAFGNIRKNGEIRLQHLGVDLEAEEGDYVYSINSGKVCFAREMTNYGKTIVIDHGLGIFSIYLHLSEFEAETGQQVLKGEVIGLVGSTGYSLAPHLHLSLKVKGSSVDPLKFIEATQEEILLEKGRTLLFSVGDIMLDRGVEAKVRENGSNWQWPFLEIEDELEKADILFGNLESPISDKGVKVGSIYSFRADPGSIEGLASSGFDVLSMANNHMLDYQSTAFEDTMDALNEAGIQYVGAGRDKKEAFGLKIVESNGNKIGFLAYTNLGPEAWKAEKGAGMAWLGEDYEDLLQDAVKRAKKMVDVLAVSVHAGIEYSKEPDRFQVEFSKICIENGADLVIGHHPHVTQKVEAYKEGFIAYSLGNFVFDQDWSEETMQGLLLKVLIENGKIKEVIQTKVSINERFQPELAS